MRCAGFRLKVVVSASGAVKRNSTGFGLLQGNRATEHQLALAPCCLGRPSVGGWLTASAARHAAEATQGLRAIHRTCGRWRCACERQLSSLSCRGRCQHRITVLRTSLCIAQTRAMRSVPSSTTGGAEQVAATGTSIALAQANAPAPNPSIERTSQSPLRALCAAAHVKR